MPHEHLPTGEAQAGPHHCTQSPPEIGPLPVAFPHVVVTASGTTCQAPLDVLYLYSFSQQPREVCTAIFYTVQGGTGPERLGLQPVDVLLTAKTWATAIVLCSPTSLNSFISLWLWICPLVGRNAAIGRDLFIYSSVLSMQPSGATSSGSVSAFLLHGPLLTPNTSCMSSRAGTLTCLSVCLLQNLSYMRPQAMPNWMQRRM